MANLEVWRSNPDPDQLIGLFRNYAILDDASRQHRRGVPNSALVMTAQAAEMQEHEFGPFEITFVPKPITPLRFAIMLHAALDRLYTP
jgi:hypothetical protein